MIWVIRALTLLIFLFMVFMTGEAAFHFKKLGFTLVMVFMSALFGYMVYFDIKKIRGK